MTIKIKNKRGWIRIVEAFVALLLIAGVLLTVVNQGYIGKEDISEEIYAIQIDILREIQVDEALRNEIISLPAPGVAGTNPSKSVKDRIQQRKPDFLDCTSKLCRLDSSCALTSFVEGDVYAQSVAITANLEFYSPKQLKLFCWVKG